MLVLGIALASLVLPFLLLLIDRKIKGGKSIFLKVFYLAFFTLLIVGAIYFYGATVFESFEIDVRSFSKIKAFFSSRIVRLLVMAVLLLFILISTIYVSIMLVRSGRAETKKEDKSSDLLSVTYDIDVIPDNSVLSMETFTNKERLEAKTLVFSNTFLQREVVC